MFPPWPSIDCTSFLISFLELITYAKFGLFISKTFVGLRGFAMSGVLPSQQRTV